MQWNVRARKNYRNGKICISEGQFHNSYLKPVDARKSRFNLSHVIQSVAIIMMTNPRVSTDPIQNTPIRIALFLFHTFLLANFKSMYLNDFF